MTAGGRLSANYGLDPILSAHSASSPVSDFLSNFYDHLMSPHDHSNDFLFS
jgi:hypothetical protein